MFWIIAIPLIAIALIGALTVIGWETFIPRWLNILADYDEWFSPIRPLPPEGEMYALARGAPEGPFVGILESISTHDYDSDKHIFVPNAGKTSSANYLTRHGLAWVGFNTYLIMREVRYDKWEKLDGSAKFGLKEKVRPGPSIYFQYNMATSVEKVDTVGNIPVSAIVTFTVQIISPREALFFAGGWEVQVTAGVQGVLREYIGTKKIDELRKEKASGNSGIIQLLTAEDGALNTDLKKFGIKIIKATFVDYDLEAGDAETNKATKAKELAILNGDASIEAARREAEAKKIAAQGIRDEYTARVESAGEHAGEFRMAEAIEKTSLTALGGNFLTSVDKK